MEWVKLILEKNFDTFLLTLVSILACCMVLHLSHHDMSEGLLNWGQSIASAFTGALLLRLNQKRTTLSEDKKLDEAASTTVTQVKVN